MKILTSAQNERIDKLFEEAGETTCLICAEFVLQEQFEFAENLESAFIYFGRLLRRAKSAERIEQAGRDKRAPDGGPDAETTPGTCKGACADCTSAELCAEL